MPTITGIPNSARTPGQDLDLRRAFDHQEELTNKASPWAKWQRVDVIFSATVNADTVISHDLDPDDPDGVGWFIEALEIPLADAYTSPLPNPVAAMIYRPAAYNRRAWAQNFIILRANLANLRARLVLVVPRVVSSASRRR